MTVAEFDEAAYRRQIVRLTSERNDARAELADVRGTWINEKRSLCAQIREGSSTQVLALGHELERVKSELDQARRALEQIARGSTNTPVTEHGDVVPSRRELEKLQRTIKRNNRDHKRNRLFANLLRVLGVDPETLDGVLDGHKTALDNLATAEARHREVSADLAAATANQQPAGRLTRELAVAAELVELRRKELQSLDVLMKAIPASAQHRGRRDPHRPVPQIGGLV